MNATGTEKKSLSAKSLVVFGIAWLAYSSLATPLFTTFLLPHNATQWALKLSFVADFLLPVLCIWRGLTMTSRIHQPH